MSNILLTKLQWLKEVLEELEKRKIGYTKLDAHWPADISKKDRQIKRINLLIERTKSELSQLQTNISNDIPESKFKVGDEVHTWDILSNRYSGVITEVKVIKDNNYKSGIRYKYKFDTISNGIMSDYETYIYKGK